MFDNNDKGIQNVYINFLKREITSRNENKISM